jgi:hypothetical protein
LIVEVGERRKLGPLVATQLTFKLVQRQTAAVRKRSRNFAAAAPASATVRAFECSGQRVAIRTKDDQVFRRVVPPVAVDVLDLERQTPRIGVSLAPAAPLAAPAGCRNQVFAQDSQHGWARRQCLVLPQR